MKRTIKKPSKKLIAILLAVFTLLAGGIAIAYAMNDAEFNGIAKDVSKNGIDTIKDSYEIVADNLSTDVVGYRFSLIDGYGKTKKVVDLYRNSYQYEHANKTKTKRSKVDIMKNITTLTFRSDVNSTGCVMVTEKSGKYYLGSYELTGSLKNPDGMIAWSKNPKNLDALAHYWGYSKGMAAFGLNERVMVEPIFLVKLAKQWHCVTEAEICLFGIKLFGGGSGGYNPDRGGTYATISRLTNYEWPNCLHVSSTEALTNLDGSSLVDFKDSKGNVDWGKLRDISNSNNDGDYLDTITAGVVPRKTFYSILYQGYGCGIVYGNEEAQKVVVKYSTGEDGGKATVTSPYKKSDNDAYAQIYNNKTVYTQTIKYGEGVTLASPSTFGLALTGHEFHHWDGNGGYFSSGVYLTYETALQFATKTASGGYELVLDAQWKAKNYTVNYYAVFDDSPAEHWLSYNATIGRTYYYIEIPDYLGFEKVDGKWHKGNTTGSTKYTPGASFTDLTTAGSTVNLYTAYKSKSYTIEFYKVLNGTTTYVDKISNKSYTSASFNLKDLPSKPTGYSNYIGWYDGDGELYSISEGKRVINNHQNESIIKLYAYSDAELYKITCNKNLPTKYDGKLGYITEGSDYYYEQYSTAYREKNSVTSASVEKITPPSIYGYTFDGYYTTSAATGGYKVVDSDGTLVKNINSKGNYKYFTADTTVYARWTKISYTATFNPGSNGKWSDGSTTNKTQTYTIDSVLNAKNTPTNTIATKKFTGWKVTTAAGNWFLNTIYENNYLVNKAGMYGNVTFTAQYETTVSTLAVDPNGGTWRNTSIITRIKGVKNQTVSIENPKRTGYSFDGWDLDLAKTASYNSANRTFKFGDPGPDSTHLSTLTANWTNNIYTINMDFANGINSKDISTKGTTVIYEKYNVAYYAENTAKTRITKITVPTASGYTFGGYYNTPDCKGTLVVDASGTIKTASTFFNSDATIYAKWTPKIFTITCNKNGGTGGTSKFYEKYGEGFYSDSACKNKITNILLPTKTNYFFLYYSYESDTAIDLVVFDENMKTNGKIIVDNTYFTKDSTIDASWVENNVLVLYRTNKKSTDETFVFKNSDYGEKDLTKVDSFERLSFGMKIILFTGMYDIEYDKLTSVDDYIAYKDDAVLDGSIYWSSDKTGKNLLSNATKSKMYSDKYEFVGWNTKADGSGKSFTDGQKVTAKDLYPDVVTDHAVITLYAQWKPKTFTVNYKWTDGTKAAEPTTYVYGKGGTLAAVPTVSYHSVDGWFTDASCAAKASNPSKTDFGDMTVYAVKTPNRYTISYRWADDPDTNIPGMYPNGYDYGVGATLADVPAVTNYVTSGWYTAKECKTKASNPSATSHANVIVYAKKTPANFDITYKYVLPDGTVKSYSSITPKTYTYGTGAKLGAAKNPDSTKYALVDGKWYTTDACTGTNVTEIKASEGGDRTYYTKLKYATFNIYYYLDKTLKKTETYTYGTGKSSLYSLAAEAGHTNAPAANATWYVGTSATAYSTSSTGTSIAKDATGNKYFHKTSKTNNLYISFWVNKDNSTMSSTTYQFIGSGTIATKDGKTYYQTQPYNDAFKLNTMKTFGITRTNYKLGNWVMFFTNGDGKGVNTAIKYSTSTSLTPAKVSTDLMNYLKTHSGVTAKNGSDITKENVYVYMAPEWVAHSATLKVDPNGGTWNEKSTVQSITQNFSTKLSVPKAVGKTVTATFNGNGGTSEKANQKGALPFKTWTKSFTFYGTMSSLTADATYTYPTNDGVTSTITASYNPLTVTFPNATRSGYKLLGWADSSSATTAKYAVGSTTTITANQTFYAVWQIEYTATMNHWLTGLKNGEGTNSSKTSIKIASTSKTFTSGKNNLTIAAADILTTLPNGVRKRPATGTYTIGTYLDDSTGKQGSAWKTYNLNKTFSNVSYNPTFQFNYELIPYTITYDYNGGKAPATANPTTYNVVYGASFKNAPTRAGYTFDGWVVKGTTTKITGFNETALASTAFADSNTVSASAFTAAVKSRTIGNKTVVAQWKANTIKVYYNANGGICAAPSHKGSTTYYHAVGTDGLMRFSTSSSVTASSAAYYSTYTYKSGDHNPYNADGAFGLSKTGYNAAKQYMINSSTGTAYGQDDGASIAAALDKQIENGKTSATLYVKWTPITYKIRYNLNGGALKDAYDTVYTNSSGSKYPQNPTSLTYGSTYGLIELPTKTGFTFNGWTISQMTNSTHRYWSSADKASTFTGTSVANTDKLAKVQFFGDLRNVQDNPDVTTDDVVFTANWTPITYTIKYDLGGGSFPNELNSQYTQGSYKYYRNPTSMKYYGTAEAGFNKYFNVEIPSRTGYIFNGWTVTKLDDSTHNIWYNGAGHTSTAISWTNTSSEGKAQMFYNLRSTSGEVLFTANWTPITYTVEYYFNGAKQASLTQTCSYPTSYTYAALPAAPAGKHYVANNWNTKNDLTGTTYNAGTSFSKLSATNGAVIKLYANTIDNASSSIIYKWREGGVDKGVITGVTPAKYTEGIATTLGNIPVLTGYTVTNQGTNKWYTGLTGTTVKQTIAATETGNKTVYADRVANTYTITYKWSDGTTISGLTPTTFKYGVGATLAAVPAVTGYTTNGWYTSAACTTKASNPSATTAENITVYASKVAKTITVKYHVNGGTVSSASHKSGSTTYYHAVGSDNLMRYSSKTAVTASSAVYTQAYTYKSGTFDPINHSTFALTKTGYTGAELYTIDGTTGTTYGTASNTAIATAFDALIESGKTTVVLYPVWTANTYTIKYVVDGVEKTNLTQTATYDVNVNLASYSESKRYVTNWYTARNASTTVLSGSTYAHGATVKNLTATKNGTVTLYAKTYVIVRFTNGTGALAGTNLISGTTTPTYEFKARSGYSNVYLYNNTSKAFTDINAYKETGLVKSLLLSGGDTGLTNARAGYQFDNWNTNTSGTGTTFKKESSGAYTFDQIAAFANSNGNVPLYAKWVINPSTLTVNPNGGTWNGSTETQSFTQSYNTTKTIPVPTGATVKATFNGNGGSTPDAVSGQKPFSKWTRTNTYGTMSSLTTDAVYTFGSTYGVTDTLTAGYGSVSVTFPTSTRTGYILQGWADSSTATTKKYDVGSTTNLTANKTFYAVWTPITYTVKYNGNGATGGSTANSTHTYDVAKNLTTNGFVRQYTVTYLDESNKTLTYPASATTANATWNGWAKTATGTVAYGPTQPISVKNLTSTNGATITLYAKWTLASITLPTPPAKEGYVPTGWVPADDPTSTPQAPGTTVTPTKDITYIPKYTPITYTVKYNGNGATGGSTANSTHTYDVAKNLTTNGFVRKYTVTYKDAEGVKITTYPASATTANATWNGWAKTATGTVAYGPTQPISVKNLTKTNGAVITLYAKWTLASVTLPPLPEIPGYEPEGWVPENDPTKDPENPGDVITPTEDIIFVPKYSPKTITVKYHANGGSVTAASHTSGTTTYYHALGSDKLLRYSTVSAVTASSAVFTTKYAYGTGTFDPINEATFGLSRTGYAVAEKYTIGSNGTVKYSTSKNTAIAEAFDGLILNGNKEVILYAVWTPNIYYVKYNGNGATAGSMSNSTYTYDKQGVLDKNKFTRQYTVTYKDINNKVITTYPTDATQAAAAFKGWAKTAAGAVAYADQYNNVLNWTATNKGTVNIYAKWELASITLPELPVVPGYEPEGWVPEDDPTKDPEKPGDVITPEEDETYVGKYKPITYTLTYNTNGGKWADNTTANKTKSFIVTDNITLRNDLSKEGYILTGWKVTSASTGSWKKNTTYKEDQNLGKGHYGNVTLTAVWVKQLYLKAIVPNADYSLNTDVISSFRLYNPTDSDRIPSSHVNLTFIVRDGSKVITTKVLENVVVPKGDSQLVWIKWTVPAVVNNNINIEAYIHEDLIEDDFGNITTVYKTAAIEESYPTPFNPDPTRPVREGWTRDSVPGTPTCVDTVSSTWDVWEYVNGAFVKKTYGITATGTATIRPDAYAQTDANGNTLLVVICPNCGTENLLGSNACRKCSNSLPDDLMVCTKSGYGIVLQAQTSVSAASGATLANANDYTGAQTAIELRPEYLYEKTTTDEKYIAMKGTDKVFVTLEKVGDVFMFVEDAEAVQYGDEDTRYINTEMWYATGMKGFDAVTYAALVEFSDFWTPNGMITVNATSNELGMSGTILDDSVNY